MHQSSPSGGKFLKSGGAGSGVGGVGDRAAPSSWLTVSTVSLSVDATTFRFLLGDRVSLRAAFCTDRIVRDRAEGAAVAAAADDAAKAAIGAAGAALTATAVCSCCWTQGAALVGAAAGAAAASACCFRCRLSLLSRCFASLLAFARLAVRLAERLLAAAAADGWSAAGGRRDREIKRPPVRCSRTSFGK